MNIWAHRGLSYRYPENTLSSFAAACEYDITGIELDIQLTCDGEMVVIHDEKVDRTTDGSGNVCDMTLEQIKRLRIMANPDSELSYETVPTFREVLELLAPHCKKWGLMINIELKNSVIRYEGMEDKVLDMVDEYGISDYIVYSSFNPDSIRLIREKNSLANIGTLANSLNRCIEISKEFEVNALHPYIHNLDVDNVRGITHLPIRAWNVRSEEPFFPSTEEIVMQDIEKLEKTGITDIFTNVAENYVALRGKKRAEIIFDKSWAIDGDTGYAVRTKDDTDFATYRFNRAYAGDRIEWKSEECAYMIFVYSLNIEHNLIYTYCYENEENWSTYNREQSILEWVTSDFLFREDCYYRMYVKRNDGKVADDTPCEKELFQYTSDRDAQYYEWKQYFQEECFKTVTNVKAKQDKDAVTLVLLTDSHYVINGTWKDSAYNILKTSQRIYPDAVVHLGDITDGITPLSVTKEYTDITINDLKKTGKPVWQCLGNHDSNYFKNNPEIISEEECAKLYLNQDKAYYYIDMEDKNLRMYFLYSFNQKETIRYGYPTEEIDWVRESFKTLPDGYKVLVFSHVPPLPEIHFWSDAIRNGEELISVLEEFHESHNNCILALIHGHNHSDQVYKERKFPIISLGCNKIEDFKDKKPEGAITYDRKLNTVTQDLWDVLVINKERNAIDLVRFGAGVDQHIKCN